MQRLHSRIEKLQQDLKPKRTVALFFVRHGHEEDDFQKQSKEYISRWGDKDKVLFLKMVEYCDLDPDYETFIISQRTKCPPGNCYADWW